MVSLHPNVTAYLHELAGDPLIEQLTDTIERFADSGRYLPEEGEKQDRGSSRIWWIIDHHSMLLYLKPPNAYILGIADGEIRGREGIEYYLEKFTEEL